MCTRISLISYLFVILILPLNTAHSTVFFYWDAESTPCNGSDLPNPPFWTGNENYRGKTRCGSTPQGSRYIEFVTVNNQKHHYTEIHNTQGLPVRCQIGKTYYLAYYARFERINGNDIWHETTSSSDKCFEMDGSGIRWMVGRGHKYPDANNQNHKYTLHSVNPGFHLNPELEAPSTSIYVQNASGHSTSNPIQLDYEVWYAIVLAVKMAGPSEHNGSLTLYVNGIKIMEYTNIQTCSSSSPDIEDIKFGGTIGQNAYDTPAHKRQFDGILLTDNLQDVINGGYLRIDEEPPSPPTGLSIIH